MNFKNLPPLTLKNVEDLLNKKKPAIFLDYDGTLTPIVPNPEDATLDEEMRKGLKDLAKLCFVAIVSGRDREDVKSLVQLDNLIYSGSHGFDTSGPGLEMQNEGGKACLPALDSAEKELKDQLKPIKGVKVERKLFAIAIHYRHANLSHIPEINRIADQVLQQHDPLKKAGGKKIIELKPDIAWNKGKAVTWLLEKLRLNALEYLPIYIGDDLTDEDAFASLRQIGGVGVLVGDHGESTQAHYRLNDTREVGKLLQDLIVFLGET